MKYCKDCWGFDRCKAQGRTVDFPVDDGVCRYFDPILPMTNADRIRNMSDEELVAFIGHNCMCDRIQDEGTWCEEQGVCEGCLLKWLKQPAEE
jgi:hypothetical protein